METHFNAYLDKPTYLTPFHQFWIICKPNDKQCCYEKNMLLPYIYGSDLELLLIQYYV